MDLDEFRSSIGSGQMPSGLSPFAESLWYDGSGDWKGAHHRIQDIKGPKAALIHAYLHRKEGDLGNAGYWYGQAGRAMPASSLETEWEALVKEILIDEKTKGQRG
jgi:hypothetical protein